jgi:antitoxin component YwqK of YwqJK toxin-antitoxin module
MNTFRYRSLLAGITCFATLGLAACGNKVLDYRNAQISNGKIYSSDANEPFSGHLTNLPEQQILLSQSGLTQVMYFVGLGNQNYHGAASESFCDIDVSDGYLNGKATCKSENSDNSRYEMSFSNGSLDGQFTVYSPTGDHKAISTVPFEKGRANGEQKVYNAITGNLAYDLNWANGIAVGDQSRYNPATGKLTFQSHSDDDGKLDGDYVEYTGNGEVFHKAHYSHGQKDGVEETFDPDTGKPASHAEWQDGRMVGNYRKWDAQGNLIQDDQYANGEKVSSSPDVQQASDHAAAQADYDTCMQDLDEHSPERYPVAQLRQWSDTCISGALKTRPDAGTITPMSIVASADNTSGQAAAPASGSNVIDACVSSWIADYQKGRDAVGLSESVSDDQIAEWQDSCRQGKKPD